MYDFEDKIVKNGDAVIRSDERDNINNGFEIEDANVINGDVYRTRIGVMAAAPQSESLGAAVNHTGLMIEPKLPFCLCKCVNIVRNFCLFERTQCTFPNTH